MYYGYCPDISKKSRNEKPANYAGFRGDFGLTILLEGWSKPGLSQWCDRPLELALGGLFP
jgi:hypothetical protein